jgi:hypothetical protein
MTWIDEQCLGGNHIVHLMCDGFNPVLPGFHASDHDREFSADDWLGSKRLAEDDPLACPSVRQQFVRTFQKVTHLVQTDLRHSSTINLCAPNDCPVTIQRSWLKLLRITDMPFPSLPSVLARGTRTLLKMRYAVPAADEYDVLIGFMVT